MALKNILSKFLLVMLFCGILAPLAFAAPSEADLKTELTRLGNNLVSYEKTFYGLPILSGSESKETLTSQLNSVLALEKKALADQSYVNQKILLVSQLVPFNQQLLDDYTKLSTDFSDFISAISSKKQKLNEAIMKLDQTNFDQIYQPLVTKTNQLNYQLGLMEKKTNQIIDSDFGSEKAQAALSESASLKADIAGTMVSVQTALQNAVNAKDTMATAKYKELLGKLVQINTNLGSVEQALNGYLDDENHQAVNDMYTQFDKIDSAIKGFNTQYGSLKIAVEKIQKLTPDAPNEQLTMTQIENLKKAVTDFKNLKFQPLADQAEALGDQDLSGEVDRLSQEFQKLISNCDLLKSALTGEVIVDTDKDGVADSSDNCPTVANADQKDSDNDKVGDVCEAVVPPIVDADKDGIADATDNCPNNANPDQKDTDGDKLGDLCDASPTVPLMPEEQQYKDWKQKYKDYDDDYDTYSDKYKDAVSDKDDKDIKKYKNKLDDLDDELDDLESDLDDQINDLEDKDDNKYDDLIDDLDNLYDDVKDLREKIAITLGKKTTVTEPVVTPSVPKTEESKVTVQTLSTLPTTGAQTATVAKDPAGTSVFTWTSLQENIWLIAGIVVLVAVIIFLLALLL